MTARTSNVHDMGSHNRNAIPAHQDARGLSHVKRMTNGDAKVLLLSHIMLIALFALAAWSPLLIAQDLFN